MNGVPDFNDSFWTVDRLVAQRDHLDSLLLVSAGQNDPLRSQLRAEHRAVCAELARRSAPPEKE